MPSCFRFSAGRLTLVPVFALACLSLAARPAAAVSVPTQWVVENAIPSTTFTNPTQVAFLPDGRWLVAEKAGNVWVIQNGVRLDLPNPSYRLPAGLKCKVRFLS